MVNSQVKRLEGHVCCWRVPYNLLLHMSRHLLHMYMHLLHCTVIWSVEFCLLAWRLQEEFDVKNM